MGKQRKTKKKTRRDVIEIARSVVEQAMGEKLTGEPLDTPEESTEPDTRNPHAVALSKLVLQSRITIWGFGSVVASSGDGLMASSPEGPSQRWLDVGQPRPNDLP